MVIAADHWAVSETSATGSIDIHDPRFGLADTWLTLGPYLFGGRTTGGVETPERRRILMRIGRTSGYCLVAMSLLMCACSSSDDVASSTTSASITAASITAASATTEPAATVPVTTQPEPAPVTEPEPAPTTQPAPTTEPEPAPTTQPATPAFPESPVVATLADAYTFQGGTPDPLLLPAQPGEVEAHWYRAGDVLAVVYVGLDATVDACPGNSALTANGFEFVSNAELPNGSCPGFGTRIDNSGTQGVKVCDGQVAYLTLIPSDTVAQLFSSIEKPDPDVLGVGLTGSVALADPSSLPDVDPAALEC